MNWCHSILLLTTAALQYSSVFSLECITNDPPITRIFNSLEEYQANIIDFIPYTPGFEGNHVEFRINTTDHLIKNIFKTYDSEHIIKLNLSHMAIKTIDKDAFLSLSCLHILDLSNNQINNLTEEAFEGLGSLRELKLNDNYLTNIPAYLFKELTNLTILDLSSNLITRIDEEAFFNLTSLRLLNLKFNSLETFPPSLRYVSNLRTLQLQSNRIRSPQFGNLNNVSKTLEILDLSQNGMENINYTTDFDFPAIKFMNLSHNFLTRLDVYAITNKFPNLEKIDINYNIWDCHVLFTLKQGLYDMNIIFDGTNSSGCTERNIFDAKMQLRSSNFSADSGLERLFDEQNMKQVTDGTECLLKILITVFLTGTALIVMCLACFMYGIRDQPETWIDWSRVKNRYNAYKNSERRPLLQRTTLYQGSV